MSAPGMLPITVVGSVAIIAMTVLAVYGQGDAIAAVIGFAGVLIAQIMTVAKVDGVRVAVNGGSAPSNPPPTAPDTPPPTERS